MQEEDGDGSSRECQQGSPAEDGEVSLLLREACLDLLVDARQFVFQIMAAGEFSEPLFNRENPAVEVVSGSERLDAFCEGATAGARPNRIYKKIVDSPIPSQAWFLLRLYFRNDL